MYVNLQELKDYINQNLSQLFLFSDEIIKVNIETIMPKDIIFEFEEIEISPTLNGDNDFKLEFTSEENYKVYWTKAKFFKDRYIGSGNINAEFIHQSTISIPENIFSGDALEAGDVVTFNITGNASQEQALTIIVDAMASVDSYALSQKVVLHGARYSDDPNFDPDTMSEFMFEQPPFQEVPRQIKMATLKFALAFLIERKIILYKGEDFGDGYTSRLKNSARKNIDEYIRWYDNSKIGYAKSTVRKDPKFVSAEQIAINAPQLNISSYIRRDLPWTVKFYE